MSKPSLCFILFSSNRLEYLRPTLNSLSLIDFSGFDVKSVLIDDYPLDRDDKEIISLAKKHGFNKVILHEKNMGITATWTEMWDLLKDDNFNYIFMHEDDAAHIKPVKVADMVELLRSDEKISQVQLGRDVWYSNEKLPEKSKHKNFKDYKYELSSKYFWMMCSLCHGSLLHLPIKEETGYDLSESVVANYLGHLNMTSCILRQEDYSPFIEHIGDYSQGVRISQEGDPGWDHLGMYREGHKYCSKTGQILNHDIK